MNKQLVQQVTATQIRPDLPEFSTGDTIRVSVRIRENNKDRQQAFEGVCIFMRGSGVSKTFTVRKDSAGVGVERTFLLNSPNIVFIEVVKHGKVRRKQLTYLRGRSGKAAKVKELLLGEEQRKALEEQRRISREAAEKHAAKLAADKAAAAQAAAPAAEETPAAEATATETK